MAATGLPLVLGVWAVPDALSVDAARVCDVASRALFLASDEGRRITGAVISSASRAA